MDVYQKLDTDWENKSCKTLCRFFTLVYFENPRLFVVIYMYSNVSTCMGTTKIHKQCLSLGREGEAWAKTGMQRALIILNIT